MHPNGVPAQVNERNQKPVHFARRVRSPVLEHVLDERLPVVLLRQIWSNYALDTPTMARTHTLQVWILLSVYDEIIDRHEIILCHHHPTMMAYSV